MTPAGRPLALLVTLLLAAQAVALPVTTRKGLVTAAHPLAARAGADVLAQGGHAADALAATAFALAVVEPHSSGLGGGGFAMLFDAKTQKVTVLDFRETAPAAATPALFEKDGVYDRTLSRQGGRSVGVPGAVAGYVHLTKTFGRLPLAKVVEPATRLAEKGFVLTAAHHRAGQWGKDVLAAFPLLSKHFLYDRDPLGQRFTQPALAKLLRDIGKRGHAAFYEGKAAAAMLKLVRRDGGVMTQQDLESYRVREVSPLEGSFRGHRVVTMPPPSAGGLTVLHLLGVLDRFPPPAKNSHDAPDRIHRMTEAWRRSFAARAAFIGDPRKVPEVSDHVARLTLPTTMASWATEIGPRATPATEIRKVVESIHEGPETSHLSVVDAAGNVAIMTTTINFTFGSGLLVPELGIVLNNENDDFAPTTGANLYGLEGGRYNAIAGGKTPVSTMAPTIVFDGDRPWIAVGAAGGSTIATTIGQVILSIVDDGLDVQRALARPRVHAQYTPDVLRAEPTALDDATKTALQAMGHTLEVMPQPWGSAQALTIDADGLRRGAADPRGEGAAVAEDQRD